MRNPYENEPSDATMARLEAAYDKYVAEHDDPTTPPMEWDEWLDDMD